METNIVTAIVISNDNIQCASVTDLTD